MTEILAKAIYEYYKLSEKERAKRTCVNCGKFDLMHTSKLRKDPEVMIKACAKFVKPNTKLQNRNGNDKP